jgi:hypothetical protein
MIVSSNSIPSTATRKNGLYWPLDPVKDHRAGHVQPRRWRRHTLQRREIKDQLLQVQADVQAIQAQRFDKF